MTGVALLGFYYQQKKVHIDRLVEEASAGVQTVGKAGVGGPFQLLASHDGQPVTEKDFDGYFKLIYFGFTNCPDSKPMFKLN